MRKLSSVSPSSEVNFIWSCFLRELRLHSPASTVRASRSCAGMITMLLSILLLCGFQLSPLSVGSVGWPRGLAQQPVTKDSALGSWFPSCQILGVAVWQQGIWFLAFTFAASLGKYIFSIHKFHCKFWVSYILSQISSPHKNERQQKPGNSHHTWILFADWAVCKYSR